MRFLFIISRIPQNGVTICLRNLIEALAGRGHDVELLVLTNDSETAISFGAAECHVLNGRLKKVPNGYLSRLSLAAALKRWVRSKPYSYDLIVSTMMSTDKIVHQAGLDPIHYWLHIAPRELLNGFPGRWKRYRRSRLFRRIYTSSNIIAVSEGLGNSVVEDGFRPRHLNIIYNGFNIDAIRRLGDQISAWVPQERYILHVGRFVPAKRHDVMLRAYSLSGLPYRLVLLTDPTPALQALILEHGLSSRVDVVPFQDNPHPFYRHAEFTVLTSDREGLPNALVESLIAGTPVLSTDCPFGPAEILTGGLRRWLAPPGDAAALAALMRRLAVEPYDCTDAVVERFSIDRMGSSFETLVAGRAAP